MEKFLQVAKKVLLFLLKTMWIFVLVGIIVLLFYPIENRTSSVINTIVKFTIVSYIIIFIVYLLICKRFKLGIGAIIVISLFVVISLLIRTFNQDVRYAYERCSDRGGILFLGNDYICVLDFNTYLKFEKATGKFNYIKVDKQGNETKYICSGWYDGCNSCGIGGICTQRHCDNYGPSRCTSWTSEEELKKECDGGWLCPYY